MASSHSNSAISDSDNQLPIPVWADDPTFQGHKIVVPQDIGKFFEAIEPALEPVLPCTTLPPTPRQRICGLGVRTFSVALAAILLVLLGAIGGIVGGLLVQRNAAGTANSHNANNPASDASARPTTLSSSTLSPVPTATPLMHASSQLASGQWVSKDEPQRNYVAYQDPVGSIVLAAWDEQNTTWAAVNITDRMLQAINPIQTKLGTPLVIVTGHKFHVTIIYLDGDNGIREVYTKDRALQYWQKGDLYTKAYIRANAQSRLASYWLECKPSCSGSKDGVNQVRLFFEDADRAGSLRGYAGAGWFDTGFEQSVRGGAALAATPFVSTSGTVDMRLFFDTGEKLGMMSWSNDTSWVLDGKPIVLSSFSCSSPHN